MLADSLRILLAGLVDYAGLFPPASLTMREVVANYASYHRSMDAWALGRLIVPVARLGELSESIAQLDPPSPGAWRVSVLAGEDVKHDAECIARWNQGMKGVAIADAAELRATTQDGVANAARAFRDLRAVYVEIPTTADPTQLIAAIARGGARAKIRTGGVTADAFPSAANVARFLRCCAEHDVAFKATAGLHHPLHDTYPLTYAPNAPRGAMFGFLNVFLAAAFARRGLPEAQVLQLLEERDTASIVFAPDAVRWHDEEMDTQRLADVRTTFAVAFGSCSFREPIDDLRMLGLL